MPTAYVVLVSAIVLGVAWVAPALAQPGVVFGVRVPGDHRDDPAITGERRRYRVLVAVAGLVVLVGGAVVEAFTAWIAVLVVVPVAQVAVVGVAYGRAHAVVRRAKESGDWYRGKRQVVVADTPIRSGGSLWLAALPAVGVLVATVVVGIVRYPDIPDQVTLHFGAGGEGDRFAAKSVGSVFALVIVQAVITAILLAVAFAAPRARADLDPEDVEGSALRHRRVTRALTHAVLLLAAGVNVCLLLASLAIWGGARTMPGWLALMPLLLVAAVIAAVVVHQSDATPGPVPEAVETEVVARDDDRFWRGGLLYVNGDDPAVLVPKRFGVGWTVNLGNPKTVVGLVVLVVGIVVLVVATA
ncbi:DUF1648 domain-containing protein [Umezawaea sp. NPDC059074]|uniref:DUF1648 domain-containing protein n=1 Tax=Umezawaea sp. NPDC059074 TaxID=3346716 RepID=UPI00369F1F05